MSIEEELREMDGVWKEIEVEDREFKPLPDGKYQVEVTEARVEHSKGSGRLQFTILMRVAAPAELAHRTIAKCSGLESERSLSFVKSDLATMGILIDKVSGLPAITTMLLGTFLEVALVTKKAQDGNTYQNCYINKLLLAGEPADLEPVDDSPF